MRFPLTYRLSALFIVVSVSCLAAWVAALLLREKPLPRKLVIATAVHLDTGDALFRRYGISRIGWSEEYWDYPPYGSPDKIVVFRDGRQYQFYAKDTPAFESWPVGLTMSPQMERNVRRDFAAINRFIQAKCPGETVDEVFAGLPNGCRFFALEADELLGTSTDRRFGNGRASQ